MGEELEIGQVNNSYFKVKVYRHVKGEMWCEGKKLESILYPKVVM